MENNNLGSKLDALKKIYLKKLESTIQEFDVLIQDETLDVEVIYSMVHKIAGTSGMYGINELSSISNDFEEYFKENSNSINIDELKIKFSNYIKNMKKIILAGD